MNPPYGRTSDAECFREENLPIGNFSVGTNSTDFGFVKYIEPYYSIVEVDTCIKANGELGGI
jgi:hypothetical protein